MADLETETAAEEPTAPQSTAERLIAALERTEETFEVSLADDWKIVFRYPEDAQEFYRLRTAAKAFAEMLKKKPSEAFVPFKRFSVDLVMNCYWIHELAVDPPFTQLEALQLAEKGGAAVAVYEKLITTIGTFVKAAEMDTIDAEKNA